MSDVLDFSKLYHTGIVVSDIESAKKEYTEAMGVTWPYAGEAEMPVWLPTGPTTLPFGFAYTGEGPHRLELVQAMPGTLWTVAGPGHAHHLGFWCEDVAATSAALAARGVPVCARVGVQDATSPAPIVLHRAETGIYLELVDAAMEPMIFGGMSS